MPWSVSGLPSGSTRLWKIQVARLTTTWALARVTCAGSSRGYSSSRVPISCRCAVTALRKLLANGRPPRSLLLVCSNCERPRVLDGAGKRGERSGLRKRVDAAAGRHCNSHGTLSCLAPFRPFPPLLAPGCRAVWHPAASRPSLQRAHVDKHRPGMSATPVARPGRRRWCGDATAPPLPTPRRSCACGSWRTRSRACAWRSAGAWARSRGAAVWPPGRPCGARCWAASSAAGCAARRRGCQLQEAVLLFPSTPLTLRPGLVFNELLVHRRL